MATSLGEGKLNTNLLNSALKLTESHPAFGRGVVI